MRKGTGLISSGRHAPHHVVAAELAQAFEAPAVDGGALVQGQQRPLPQAIGVGTHEAQRKSRWLPDAGSKLQMLCDDPTELRTEILRHDEAVTVVGDMTLSRPLANDWLARQLCIVENGMAGRARWRAEPEEVVQMKAIWNGVIVAQSDDTVVVEGNHYFARDSLKPEYISFSNHRSSCHWKGQAHYYSLIVNGEMNPEAVWFYPEPLEAAAQIKGRVAFWKGVKVEE